MSLTVQFYTMLAMFGMGSWVGAALDTYGRFLKRPSRARWFVFINDLVFWIVQGLIIFYTLLIVNEGELRFYVFLAIVCGYAAYQSLLKSAYMSFLEILTKLVVGAYNFMAKLTTVLIIKPIRYIIQILLVFLISIWKLTLNVLAFFIKVLLTPIKWLGMLLWRLVPKKIKMFFYKIAGIQNKIKNLRIIVRNWLKNFRG
ncbi:spore cortex biosynthesis protein YabQ [Bacillus sp. DJP31]|uniref:spore cortex biosynthesis protein YabQ n=1 Tax=Bacillus sp. DJP31 TaxID=3409789 RepID=UPI003BB504E3